MLRLEVNLSQHNALYCSETWLSMTGYSVRTKTFFERYVTGIFVVKGNKMKQFVSKVKKCFQATLIHIEQ